MYHKLLNYAKNKPHEYAESTSKFWDDEHISKYMLEAHLDPDTEAASRQHAFIMRSAGWIAQMSGTPQGKKLLDMGCGAGIYAEAFHAAGFEVTGIDFAKRSIDYATEQAAIKQLPIIYRYENYLEMEYENEFDAATLIFCDFGVLSPENRTILLQKIRRALKPGGIFILDGFTANQYTDFTESRHIEYEEDGFWNASPHLCIKNNYRYDDSQVYLEQYLIVTEHDCQCYNIWNQAFSTASLEKELSAAGFSDIKFYGNVCGEVRSDDGKTLCAAAHSR